MKYIIFVVIFISIICSSFTLHIDDNILNNDFSDNFHHDKHIPLIEKENFSSLNRRKQNNTDIKVSVIIPSYNSEKFIGRCIESALNQTLKEIEIIVIDDCSNDSTRSIIIKYKKKDNRIKPIFNEVNKGVGISRNRALNRATGEFIGFIDADDYVDPGWYQYLYENSKDMDLVRGIRVMHEFSDTYRKSKKKPYGCIVPSIIRKSFIDKHKLRFPGYRKFEDSYFNELVKMRKPRTKLLPDNGIYYHYVIREGSLSNYVNPNKNNTNNATVTPTQTTTTIIETIEPLTNVNNTSNINEENSKFMDESPSFVNPNNNNTNNATETPTQTTATIIETIEPLTSVNNTFNINEGNNKFLINMDESPSNVNSNNNNTKITSIAIIFVILVIGTSSYIIIKRKKTDKEKGIYEKLEEVNDY